MFRHKELLKAITDRNASLVKEILLTKPSVESLNEKGFNALQLAIKNNMTEICEDILSLYKSKLVLTDNLTRDVLHLAIKQSNIQIIKMLIFKIGEDKITSSLYLKEATKFVKTDKGKEVYDYLYLIGINNLHIIDLIQMNVGLGIILNRIEKDHIKIDHSILDYCIGYDTNGYFIPLYDIAKKQGLDVNDFIPDFDWTLLFQAVYEYDIDIVEFLCNDPDIDVNKGSETETPFYMACDGSRNDVIKLLLDRGADPNLRPVGDKPAIFHLIEYGFEPDMIRDIVNKGLNINEIYSDDNILQFFIKYVHCRINDSTDTIKLLLEYVDINHRDSMGSTALTNAVQKDFDDLVEVLIDAGADPNIKNKYNKTAYDYASDEIKEFLPEQKINGDVLYEEDPRIFTKQFNLKVFDIINFDEVDINEFIKNKENIIYFIQDELNSSLSLYGITRKDLRKCSKTNDAICTFPTGHTIDVDEAFKFTIEDFSLFQLTKKNVKCFTCQKFEENF